MAFIYDTFVTEQLRGKSIAPFIINEVMKSLTQKGVRFIACHIIPANQASQKTYRKITKR